MIVGVFTLVTKAIYYARFYAGGIKKALQITTLSKKYGQERSAGVLSSREVCYGSREFRLCLFCREFHLCWDRGAFLLSQFATTGIALYPIFF